MTETPRDNEETNATTSVGKIENFVSKHFVRLLIWLAVSGGALAIFGPWILYVTGLTGETDANLRLHILYVTGGTIAVLGLVETHRKNTTDRIKAEADIQNYQASQNYQSKTLDEQARQFTENIAKEREKIEADKAENEQDYIRQVHAERRSRYTTAIEQLSNDKASIRLGGIYSLVGLADEWLADEKTIFDIMERLKEGQIIINNLCAYIRSPFLLAEHAEQLDKPYAKDLQKDFAGDKEKFDADKRSFVQEKAALEEERQIRQIIIQEVHKRIYDSNHLKSLWSKFDYDFSGTYFFYFVNFAGNIFEAFPTFYGSTFAWGADFSRTTFDWGADFSQATFACDVDFSRTTFRGANFFRAIFARGADFSQTTFTADSLITSSNTKFSQATFAWGADFSQATFACDVDFSQAIFQKIPIFARSPDNNTKFSNKVNPKYYNFEVSPKSPYKIQTEEQEYKGVKFILPKYAEIFEPPEFSEGDKDELDYIYNCNIGNIYPD